MRVLPVRSEQWWADIRQKKFMLKFLNNFAWSMQPAQTEELQRDTKFNKHTYRLCWITA